MRAETMLPAIERMAQDGVELSDASIRRMAEADARVARLGRVALWVIAGASVLLLFRR